jgi:hypothetical protein
MHAINIALVLQRAMASLCFLFACHGAVVLHVASRAVYKDHNMRSKVTFHGTYVTPRPRHVLNNIMSR